jgi:hypothetical protein
MNKPLKVNKLLRSGPLSPLLARARDLVALDEQVHALLPLPLQPHCHVLSIHDRILVLAADSPVWAARLRFHAPKLVKQLSRQQTAAVRTVRIRVRPPEKSITSTSKQPSGLKQGPHRAAALQQAAQNVSDPRLKSALLRLSRR